jgi:hypothetical protein
VRVIGYGFCFCPLPGPGLVVRDREVVRIARLLVRSQVIRSNFWCGYHSTTPPATGAIGAAFLIRRLTVRGVVETDYLNLRGLSMTVLSFRVELLVSWPAPPSIACHSPRTDQGTCTQRPLARHRDARHEMTRGGGLQVVPR